MDICKLNLEFWTNLQKSPLKPFWLSGINVISSTFEPYICQIIRFLP
jgi:hypothetical protein